jgi:hypothetical protein
MAFTIQIEASYGYEVVRLADEQAVPPIAGLNLLGSVSAESDQAAVNAVMDIAAAVGTGVAYSVWKTTKMADDGL